MSKEGEGHDKGHGEGHDKKETVGQKAWNTAGTVLVVGLAVVVICYLVGGLLQPTASGLQTVREGMRALNLQLMRLPNDIRDFVVSLVQIALPPVLLFLLVGILMDWLNKKDKKGGDGHP